MRPRKRSFSIRGHRTSLSLEEPFWSALKEIAATDGRPLADLVGSIDARRGDDTGLSTAVRLFILDHYRRACLAAPASQQQNAGATSSEDT